MSSDWISDHLHIANNLCKLPPGRVLSYIANAGLANRLRAWFFASCLAKEHGYRLAHRWRCNTAFGSSWSWCFAADRAVSPDEDHDPNEHIRLPWRRVGAPPQRTTDSAWLARPPTMFPAVLSRVWQYAPAELWIRAELPRQAFVSEFRRQALGDITRRTDTIGVHVRLGDFQEIDGVRPLQRYLEATTELIETYSGNYSRILVCSDQIEWALPSFVSHFRGLAVTSTETPAAASRRSDPQAARQALAQFRALSTCGACVLTPGSSFGAMAAALGGIPSDRIRHA